MDQITRIREKLARAGHALNPPLSEEDVAAFEAEHEIRLPEEYRRFVLELGDGGAGPSYGLAPLLSAFDWDESPDGFLAAPSHFGSGVPFKRDRWDEWFDEPRQGSLAVVHHGCSDYTQLVVSGPGRGKLVNINLDGWGVPDVAEDPDFLSWYERWLDELLAGISVTMFGRKLPGDEAVLAAILADDPSAERRARAAFSLGCLPSIGRTGADALAAAITDPHPEIRRAALGAVRSSRVEVCEPRVRAALVDPVAEVRVAAMWALRELNPTDVAERARALLDDDDPDVVFTAVCALKDREEVTVGDLEPLTHRRNANIRGTAAWALGEAAGDAAAVLARTAVDEDRNVRIHAVQSASKRDDRALLALFQDRLNIDTDPTVIINLEKAVAKWTS